MRTAEEMMRAVHARAAALRRSRHRRQLTLTGGACGLLSAALLTSIGIFGGLRLRPVNESYAEASLLSDSAGGYVLAAVAAFMAGVIVSVLCIRRRKRAESPIQSTKARDTE